MDLLPKYPHSAIICGQTGCGKTVFILDLLEERYTETFAHIVILCPTVRWNKTYHSRSWVWTDPRSSSSTLAIGFKSTCERFSRSLPVSPRCISSTTARPVRPSPKRRTCCLNLLSRVGTRDQSVWVLTQKYNSVLKDLREQTKSIAVFHCKDRDSFEDCLRENDIVPTREEELPLKSCYLKLAILSSYCALLSQLLTSCNISLAL